MRIHFMMGTLQPIRNWSLPFVAVFSLLGSLEGTSRMGAEEISSPRAGWHFKFQDFLISAWWPPDLSDAEFQVYAEAGFNVLHYGRYYELDDQGRPVQEPNVLDVAQKYGLGVMWDTYTWNQSPWGHTVDPSTFPQVPADVAAHHYATPAEFQWLVEHIAPHPAVIGFLLADDMGTLSPDVVANTHYLRERAPHLMPWVCQNWSDPQSLAQAGNPLHCVQTYPTLYQRGSSASAQMFSYCHSLAAFREARRKYDLIMWPIFDVSGDCSDSLVRFQVYSAIAYGAEGIWYFTYNGGGIVRLPDPEKGEPSPAQTVEQVRQRMKPSYGPLAATNWRLRVWNRKLLGRDPVGVFCTGWNDQAWPFPEDRDRSPVAQAAPSPEKLVASMSSDLLAGVRVQKGEAPQVMVVDCRVSKEYNLLPPREVEIRFNGAVQEIRVISDQPEVPDVVVKGHRVKLILPAGGGQLLELVGEQQALADLGRPEAIYAPGASARGDREPIPLSTDDLKYLRAAKLRFDLAGSETGEPYRKRVFLNGQEVGFVPGNSLGDHWELVVLDLTPEHLPLLQAHNIVTIDNIRSDAWKLRRVELAVQRAEGTWVKSTAFEKTYASAGWAFFEGEAFPQGDQLAIELDFMGR